MAFDLFGLLPNPDEAYRNAPQLRINDSRLKQLRERLTGLDKVQESNLRNQSEASINRSVSQAKNTIENSTTNPATAIAQGNQVDQKTADIRAKSERFITNQDLKLEQSAQNRYGKEYANIENKRNQNKLARETARQRADNARKGGLAQIGGKLLGAGLSLAIGPEGFALGSLAGDAVAKGVQDKKAKTLKGKAEVKKYRAESKPQDPQTFYTVQDGETLESIGKKLGFSAWELMKYNPQITESTNLTKGQKIAIDPFRVKQIDNVYL